MLRLLRQVLRGPCRVEAQADARMLALTGEGGQTVHAAGLLQAALAAGLLTQEGETVHARKEAASYLRRHLATQGEETFAGQHRLLVEDRVEVAGAAETVRRNLLESPLAHLGRLKDRQGQPFFPPGTIEAGERLSVDFERGHLAPCVTASWEPRLSTRTPGMRGGQPDLTDSAMAARLRVGRAVEAMGPELSGVALDVCCFGKGLERVEQERGWPVRSAKLMLRTALLALERHYAPPDVRARRRHAWGAEGYRPEL
ncbi:DUF6456 domain-containing protein [Rhizobium sp. CSW-27]|uniref:DUF6456 domain-containing protein n=1 Tax=Rhizobium sp. CSW-27 TaxID=2839985 RepID=UPI001C02ED12|nr:DUF6456 domain-containing protein [Rhizobium sp. CSW-27]MBT9368631.1 hypothetical protein [Rhizobium sp. CSW-27]